MMKTKDPNAQIRNKDLDEAVDAIMGGVNKIIVGVEGLATEMRTGFKQVDSKLNKVETELAEVKDEVGGLKADLVDTVSKKEFHQIKSKVDKYLTI